MKHLSRLRNIMSSLAVATVIAGSSVATVAAAPAQSAPANRPAVSGPQAKPAVAPGTRDAKQTQKLGPTNDVKTDAQGKPLAASSSFSALAGNIAGVDFQGAPLNYCWKNFVYTPVRNTTTVTKYAQVKIWNQGMYRDITFTLAPGATEYAAFYGVDGAYTAYLYVWNSSTASYQYDEFKTSSNTCNVSVTRSSNTGGWVQLKIQNLGTASATQISTELAPYPANGTYTGTQYDYPVPGGAAIYRWFQVGTQPYGIVSSTYGSFNMPTYFTGDL